MDAPAEGTRGRPAWRWDCSVHRAGRMARFREASRPSMPASTGSVFRRGPCSSIRGYDVSDAKHAVPMTFRSRRPTNHDIAEDMKSVGGILEIQPGSNVYETTVPLIAGQTVEYGLARAAGAASGR